jgi:hypothetical protein
MQRLLMALFVTAGLLSVPIPILAHHGTKSPSWTHPGIRPAAKSRQAQQPEVTSRALGLLGRLVGLPKLMRTLPNTSKFRGVTNSI